MKERIIILLIFGILISATAISARDCGYIKIIKFNDANENQVWDQGEVGVPAFTFAVAGPESFSTFTQSGGIVTTDCISPGEYTVTESILPTWKNTTATSRTVTVSNGTTTEIRFGNVQVPDTDTTTTICCTTTTTTPLTTTTLTTTTTTPTTTTLPGQCRILIYSLQPAGTSPVYENLFSNIATQFGYAFSNRQSQPVITGGFLSQYDLVMFINGCGGATGLFTQDELNAIRNYYLSGGSLVLAADDNIGDINSPGECQSRINQISANLGATFYGLVNNLPGGCFPISSSSPIFSGVPGLSKYTGAYISLSGQANWGGTTPSVIATVISTGQTSQAYIPRTGGHGAVLFDPDNTDFGGCNYQQYVQNIVYNMAIGCPTPTTTTSTTFTTTSTSTTTTATSTTIPTTSTTITSTTMQLILAVRGSYRNTGYYVNSYKINGGYLGQLGAGTFCVWTNYTYNFDPATTCNSYGNLFITFADHTTGATHGHCCVSSRWAMINGTKCEISCPYGGGPGGSTFQYCTNYLKFDCNTWKCNTCDTCECMCQYNGFYTGQCGSSCKADEYDLTGVKDECSGSTSKCCCRHKSSPLTTTTIPATTTTTTVPVTTTTTTIIATTTTTVTTTTVGQCADPVRMCGGPCPPCPTTTTTTTIQPGSCVGTCGGTNNGVCWCDSYCNIFDDCCPDYQQICLSGSTTTTIQGALSSSSPKITRSGDGVYQMTYSLHEGWNMISKPFAE